MKRFFLTLLLIFIMIYPTINFKQSIYTQASQAQSVDIPILMYHSILKSKQGQYIISPDNFKSDLNWLKDHGYTTIFIQDIIDYCKGKNDLPEKPVVITFDDGHYNNYYYAYPILKELDYKAEINIIGCHSEYSSTSGDCSNPNYSHLTWNEIKELHDSKIFEIGNHTYNMHSFKPRYGIAQLDCETLDVYKQQLSQDVNKLENKFTNNCGFKTNIFAFPFGKYSNESIKILKELGFEAFLTCNENINHLEKGNETQLEKLKRFNRTGTLSTYQFFKKIGLT